MNSFEADFGRTSEADRIFSQQGVEETRLLFHCFINEVDQSNTAKSINRSMDKGIFIQETVRNCTVEKDHNGLAKFNIPNFVSTDPNSSSADEDLLIYDPAYILENNPTCSNQPNRTN